MCHCDIFTLGKKNQNHHQQKKPQSTHTFHLEEKTAFLYSSPGSSLEACVTKQPYGGGTLFPCLQQSGGPGCSAGCSVWGCLGMCEWEFCFYWLVVLFESGMWVVQSHVLCCQEGRAWKHTWAEQRLVDAVIWRCPQRDAELWLTTVSNHLTCLSQTWLPWFTLR